MADKRLRLIVEAVTSSAQQALRGLSNTVKQSADDMSRSLDKPAQAAQGLGGEMKLLATVAGVALADMAMRYGRMAVEAITSTAQMAAANLAVETSFEHVATQYGLGSSKIIEALRRASKGTIDDFGLMAAASTAMRLGVASNIEEFEDLMKITYVRARETGKSVADAWNWMAIGIGRGSPRILDNLNILIKEEQVMEDWAQTIGKTADELTLLERQEATRNAVLQQGVQDLENWNDAGYEAIDVFERYNATMAELRQELGERLLPAVTAVAGALTELMQVARAMEDPLAREQEVFGQLVESTGSISTATESMARNIELASQGMIDYAQAMKEAHRVAVDYKLGLVGIDAGIQEDLMAMRQAEEGMGRLGSATDDTTQDLEEQQEGLKKGADIWTDYLARVTEENWQYAQRYDDIQFSMLQAAERAMFDLMKIERDATDRTGDLLADAAIRIEADTAEHNNRLRYQKRDLLDELSDMEWDYQRERRESMDQAGWWIRQALGEEFAERDRIAKTGDKKALAEYDKVLLERIRAIDPAYAKELEKLQELHEHEEDVEKRDGRQGIEREKDDWEIRSRQQEQALGQQLTELERNLGYQREEWRFHGDQRAASEERSMTQLGIDYGHALDTMWTTTNTKLSEIEGLYAHYGEAWALALIQGMAAGQMYSPSTGYDPSTFVNPFAGGQPYALPGAAPAGGGGTVITNNVTVQVGGGVTPYTASQVANQVAVELGDKIRQKVR